jgi:hypothetical protein
MSQTLTIDKARQMLKELQYAKAATGGQLSMKEEYYKQALEKLLVLWEEEEKGQKRGGF